MQPVLKGLHSPDVYDLKTYLPDEEDNFGFLLEASIGSANGEAADIFSIMVCTPKWFMETYRPSDMMLGVAARFRRHTATVCARVRMATSVVTVRRLRYRVA